MKHYLPIVLAFVAGYFIANPNLVVEGELSVEGTSTFEDTITVKSDLVTNTIKPRSETFIEMDGFTKLGKGNDSPAVKMYRNFTPVSNLNMPNNTCVNVNSIDPTNIVSITAIVSANPYDKDAFNASNYVVQPNNATPEYEYNIEYRDLGPIDRRVCFVPTLTNSDSLIGGQFSVLVVYVDPEVVVM